MIVGLSGTNSSGKDTVAEYLEGLGFFVVSLSDMIREKMDERGTKITRGNMVKVGNDLEKEFGKGSLAKMALDKYGWRKNLLISSVRKQAEAEYLKSRPESVLIFVDAPIELRYERAIKRQREGEEDLNLKEFKKQEDLEMTGIGSQNLGYCKEHADIIIENDGNLLDLYKKIDKAFEKIAYLSYNQAN